MHGKMVYGVIGFAVAIGAAFSYLVFSGPGVAGSTAASALDAAYSVLPSDIPERHIERPARAPEPEYPAAVQHLRAEIAAAHRVVPSDIVVLSVDSVVWNDGCLGLGQPHESCAFVQVPGYRAVFATQLERYVYRTDTTGSLVRLEPGIF